MTMWLPLQGSFLALCCFICQICEFCHLPRPGFWRGPRRQRQLGSTWVVQMPSRHIEIMKFISYLQTENVTFGRCGKIQKYLIFYSIAGSFTYFENYIFLDPPMIELSIVFSPKIVLHKSQRQQAPVKLCLFVFRNKIIISLIN